MALLMRDDDAQTNSLTYTPIGCDPTGPDRVVSDAYERMPPPARTAYPIPREPPHSSAGSTTSYVVGTNKSRKVRGETTDEVAGMDVITSSVMGQRLEEIWPVCKIEEDSSRNETRTKDSSSSNPWNRSEDCRPWISHRLPSGTRVRGLRWIIAEVGDVTPATAIGCVEIETRLW